MEYEYVFGTSGSTEILRVKGPAHTDLSGFQQVTREWPDQTITDRFRVVCRLKSDEDGEENCYDWYEIDRHYRTVDKSSALRAEMEDTDAMCVDHEYRMTLLELGLSDTEI